MDIFHNTTAHIDTYNDNCKVMYDILEIYSEISQTIYDLILNLNRIQIKIIIIIIRVCVNHMLFAKFAVNI